MIGLGALCLSQRITGSTVCFTQHRCMAAGARLQHVCIKTTMSSPNWLDLLVMPTLVMGPTSPSPPGCYALVGRIEAAASGLLGRCGDPAL